MQNQPTTGVCIVPAAATQRVFPWDVERVLLKIKKLISACVLPQTKTRNLLGYPSRSHLFTRHEAMQSDSRAFLACKTWSALPAIRAHAPWLATAHIKQRRWDFRKREPVQTYQKRAYTKKDYTKLYTYNNKMTHLAYSPGLQTDVVFDSAWAVNTRPLTWLAQRR